MKIGRETVFVVSGAAGSIVSAITADLAVASGGIFHLLDLTPAPDRDDPELAALPRDPRRVEATLAARMKAARRAADAGGSSSASLLASSG
jgi:hypothetical protein